MSEENTDKKCYLRHPDNRIGMNIQIEYDADKIKGHSNDDEIYLGDLIRELVKIIKVQDINKTFEK